MRPCNTPWNERSLQASSPFGGVARRHAKGDASATHSRVLSRLIGELASGLKWACPVRIPRSNRRSCSRTWFHLVQRLLVQRNRIRRHVLIEECCIRDIFVQVLSKQDCMLQQSSYRRIVADVIVYIFFSLVYDRVNPLKAPLYVQIKFRGWKCWIIRATCTIFSSLHAITKEIAAIENCEIAGWQKR